MTISSQENEKPVELPAPSPVFGEEDLKKDKQNGEKDFVASEELSDLYKSLVTKGAHVYQEEGAIVPLEGIEWADVELLQEGIQFYRKHMSSVFFMSLLSLILGLAVKSTATVFYRMGDAMTAKGQLIRAISTQHGFAQFYEVIMEKPQEINKFFHRTWKMHAFGGKVTRRGRPLPELLPEPEEWEEEIAKVLRKDLDHLHLPDELTVLKKVDTWSPEHPLNQLDMSLTTLNSFLPLWLHPTKYGIKNHEEMKGFIHLWAVFVKLLGVKDEFNICLPENYHQTFRNLYENALLGSLRNMDSYGVHLINATVVGIGKVVPVFTFRGYLYVLQKYCLEVEGYTGEHLWPLMDWRDKLCVGVARIYYFGVGYVPGFRFLINGVFVVLMKVLVKVYIQKKGKSK